MTVYIEIVLIENFIIDCFLLLMAEKITYIPAKHPLFASLFGAIYALIMPMFSVGTAVESAIVLLFMCIICFSTVRIKSLLYTFTAVFCSASALFGIVNLLFRSEGFFYSDDVFFILALCSSFFSVGMYRFFFKFMQQRKIRENTAILDVCGKSFSAFIDSGNSLYYKSTPVILISKSALDYSPEKPLIIPYSSVNACGAFLGFCPQKAFLTYMNKTVELKCVVALSDRKFQNNFDALLHPDLIKECI